MLKGSFVDLITPFKNNEIDYNALENLLNFHLKNKTDGVLLCSNTGESSSLAEDEKERFVRFCVRKIQNKIPIIVETGTNNLHHTISATVKAKNWGADYVQIVTPYFIQPDQNGLFEYFRIISEKTELPIIIYNCPQRTGVNIETETILKLAKYQSKIIGLNDDRGNFEQVSKIIKETPPDFSLFYGDDILNLLSMSYGGKGIISQMANLIPDQIHSFAGFILNRELKKALSVHRKLFSIFEITKIGAIPVIIKEALNLMEICGREVRLPHINLNENKREKLKNIISEFGLIK